MIRRLPIVVVLLACALRVGAAEPVPKARVVGSSIDHVADFMVRTGERLQLHPRKSMQVAGRALAKTGRATKYLAGSATLQHTSFELEGSVGTAVPGLDYLGDANVGFGAWSGSAAYWREVKEGRKVEQHFNAGFGVNTLVAGVGYNTTYGRYTALNGIPGFSASTFARGFSVEAQIPNLALVALGEVRGTPDGHYARGPYASVGLSVPLLPFLGMPIYVSGGLTLYYPPLASLTRRMRKHVDKLAKVSAKLEHAVKKAAAKIGIGADPPS